MPELPVACYTVRELPGFSHNPLDRASDMRDDPAFIETHLGATQSRFLVFEDDSPLLRRDGDSYQLLFTREDACGLGNVRCVVFLGLRADGTALFGQSCSRALVDPLAGQDGIEAVDLRTLALGGLVSAELLSVLGQAKSVLDWHARHRFCARCGHETHAVAGGWRRDCPACEAQHFPRVDPVVIMLAIDKGRCLLGRSQRFPEKMYSALAGFMEAGETVEDAVRRETREEAGIVCSHIAYAMSQPWPFPSSLMIGCFARATGSTIAIDTNELEDARWFSRDEVQLMLDDVHPDGLTVPRPFSVAHHLLRIFSEKGDAVIPV